MGKVPVPLGSDESHPETIRGGSLSGGTWEEKGKEGD